MLEKFAAQSLVEYDGELIFSKEKFAELIIKECLPVVNTGGRIVTRPKLSNQIQKHFGIK